MTIVASVKVRDGVVLASDSMTTIQAQLQVAGGTTQVVAVKTYEHARKLFRIDSRPVGVLTWGAGNLGPRSIESFILEVGRSTPEAATVQSIGALVQQTVAPSYQHAFGALPPDQQPEVGFLIAGYSGAGPFAEEWEVRFPTAPAPVQVRQLEQTGAAWRGIWYPFQRIFFGADPRIPAALKTALGSAGIDVAVAGPLVDQVLANMVMPVYFDGMPVQDAIDLARFILQTTISAARFEAGTALCGGPLQIAAILPETGWQWIQQPELRA